MVPGAKGNRVRSPSQAKPARVAPQGALIFDNWTKRRTASHDTGRKKPKQERNKTMKLQEALRGMKVNNWEMRVNDRGRRVVYVRFAPKEPAITMNVNHEIH